MKKLILFLLFFQISFAAELPVIKTNQIPFTTWVHAEKVLDQAFGATFNYAAMETFLSLSRTIAFHIRSPSEAEAVTNYLFSALAAARRSTDREIHGSISEIEDTLIDVMGNTHSDRTLSNRITIKMVEVLEEELNNPNSRIMDQLLDTLSFSLDLDMPMSVANIFIKVIDTFPIQSITWRIAFDHLAKFGDSMFARDSNKPFSRRVAPFVSLTINASLIKQKITFLNGWFKEGDTSEKSDDKVHSAFTVLARFGEHPNMRAHSLRSLNLFLKRHFAIVSENYRVIDQNFINMINRVKSFDLPEIGKRAYQEIQETLATAKANDQLVNLTERNRRFIEAMVELAAVVSETHDPELMPEEQWTIINESILEYVNYEHITQNEMEFLIQSLREIAVNDPVQFQKYLTEGFRQTIVQVRAHGFTGLNNLLRMTEIHAGSSHCEDLLLRNTKN